jgi:formiminotetrahydrofolate cyclodeaminase
MMSDKLLEIPLRELLEKFAAGKHKPGSGSAAALLGLISCALSRTVISLTIDRPTYSDSRVELEKLSKEIQENIQPLLEEAFVQDSVFFDRVIAARKARDASSDHAEWWRLSHKALSEMDTASSIALDIAQKCIRMTEIAIRVFDSGFKSAQGDSEVAIEAALSGAKGALSVVYLNLHSFRGEAHAKKTMDDSEELANVAKSLQLQLDNRMEQLRDRAITRNSKISLNAKKLLLKNEKRNRYSDEELRQIVKNLHSELWLNRDEIWTDTKQLQPVHIIDPATTFSLHGYSFEEKAGLGQYMIDGEIVEIAGFVDNQQKVAQVSRKFAPDIRRFTSAHELGHAVLHEAKKLFRDRPLDGGIAGNQRSHIEREADAFAKYFLMPETQVREIFSQIFGPEQFYVNRNTAFALGFQSLEAMRTALPTMRQVSTYLATTRIYQGIAIRSLCEIFGVSQTAMAIRVEELSLIASP